ncbi:MAG: O-acetyl-ADP-ribose deacetylase [Candidatus Bathyarchaeia archaeon]
MGTYIIGQTTVELVQGDITEQETEAIVNAANSSLMGGGGVDGAIHRRGGPEILEACRRIRETQWPKGLPTGKAVVTPAGKLRAKFVIHTVGPIWYGGSMGEESLLHDCYWNSLILATQLGVRTIAFPAISTGAYGYPIYESANVALRTVVDFLRRHDFLTKVVFVLFTASDLMIYEKVAAKLLASD